MQLASATGRLKDRRESWIVFFVTTVIGTSVAFFLYSIDRFSLIYYGDSVSHLVRAREFVDSINPGLFEQLGTAWLPLPHLLLLPFTLIDPLFRTGFAGTALSLPCLAITSVLLYNIIKSHLSVGYVAIVGALLYATNPSILYMGITPMTEAPFMLFFIGAAYFFMRWMSRPRNYLSFNPSSSGKGLGIASLPASHGSQSYRQSSPLYLDLIMCSIFVSLATLCRYEGWVLPLFFVSCVVITVIRKKGYYHSRKHRIGTILVSTLSFSGIALWLIWNAYAYNDPLEFANAPYFSAASQALEGPNRVFLYLQPWNVASLYGITAFAIYGPVLLVTALLGYLFHRCLGKSDERRKRKNLYLFLAMPPLFTIVSLLAGVGEMNQRQWFNSRFLTILAPLVISLACVFVLELTNRLKKNHLLSTGIVFVFFAYQIALAPAFGVVMFLDALYQFSGTRPFQLMVSETLSSTYDGKSRILIIAGSSQQNEIMQASGIPLRQFDPIVESGSYKDSFKEPWKFAKYMVLAKKPDLSAKNVADYWINRLGLLNQHFDTIYEDEYYWIKKLF
jgi:Dolichyl-phosphate-mannose-protein mannosyltransferase